MVCASCLEVVVMHTWQGCAEASIVVIEPLTSDTLLTRSTQPECQRRTSLSTVVALRIVDLNVEQTKEVKSMD